MKKLKILSVLLIVYIITTVISPVVVANDEIVNLTITGYRDYDYAREVFELTNAERIKNGLSVLRYDSVLTEAAMKRAEELAVYFSHTRPTGDEWYTVCGNLNAENIASGTAKYETPQTVLARWMNSSGHRGNILDINNHGYMSIGVGCYLFKDTLYWVQLFSSTSLNEEPTETGKTEIYEATVEVSPVNIINVLADFSNSDLTLKVGETMDVTQVYIENSLYDIIPVEKNEAIFTTSSDTIASIDSNGQIIAYSEGVVEVYIYVGERFATYNVTVLKNDDIIENNDDEQTVEDKEEIIEDKPNIEEENQEIVDEPEENIENIQSNVKLEVITDEYGTYLKGDLNNDGMVNSLDASIVLDLFKNGNVTEEMIRRGDMNGDQMINSIDASIILDIFKYI